MATARATTRSQGRYFTERLLAFELGMGGEGTACWNAHTAEVVNAASRTGRHGAAKVTDNIGGGRSRSWRFTVVHCPLSDGSIDLPEVGNTGTDLGLGAGGGLQLLRLGEGLRGGGARGFGLGLHALNLGLGGLSLEGELRVLITDLANLVAQAEDVLVLFTEPGQFIAGGLGLRLVGASLGCAELFEFLGVGAELGQFGSLLLVGVVKETGGNGQGHYNEPG